MYKIKKRHLSFTQSSLVAWEFTAISYWRSFVANAALSINYYCNIYCYNFESSVKTFVLFDF